MAMDNNMIMTIFRITVCVLNFIVMGILSGACWGNSAVAWLGHTYWVTTLIAVTDIFLGLPVFIGCWGYFVLTLLFFFVKDMYAKCQKMDLYLHIGYAILLIVAPVILLIGITIVTILSTGESGKGIPFPYCVKQTASAYGGLAGLPFGRRRRSLRYGGGDGEGSGEYTWACLCSMGFDLMIAFIFFGVPDIVMLIMMWRSMKTGNPLCPSSRAGPPPPPPVQSAPPSTAQVSQKQSSISPSNATVEV